MNISVKPLKLLYTTPQRYIWDIRFTGATKGQEAAIKALGAQWNKSLNCYALDLDRTPGQPFPAAMLAELQALGEVQFRQGKYI